MTSDGVFSGIAKAGTWNASIPVPGGERLRRPWPAQMHGRQQRLRAGQQKFPPSDAAQQNARVLPQM